MKFNITELVRLQDRIIDNPQYFYDKLKTKWAINELNKWRYALTDVFRRNPVAKNNVAIRQYYLLSSLHYFLNPNDETFLRYRNKADILFKDLCVISFDSIYYMEGYSYFKYVYSAFVVLLNVGVPTRLVDQEMMEKINSSYQRLACFNGQIPVNETRFDDFIHPRTDITKYHDDCYTVYVNQEKNTYILITHNKHIENFKYNGHINYDFGHISIWKDGVWIVTHPWYEGYEKKKTSDMGKPQSYNVVLKNGKGCNNLRYTYDKDTEFHYLSGNGFTRRIAVKKDFVDILDIGSKTSTFINYHKTWFTYNSVRTSNLKHMQNLDVHNKPMEIINVEYEGPIRSVTIDI